MKITVYGTGYVGLVTGACFAEVGNDVVCMDVDADRIARLKKGDNPLFEPGLDELLHNNAAAGRLTFSTDAAEAVNHGLFQFIAVGTPPEEDGSADLQYVLQVADAIGEHLNDYKVVVDKSTVPVGTAAKVRERIKEKLARRGASHEFDVVSNPEFQKEGDAVNDFMRPGRIVIGTESERAAALLRELYAPINWRQDRLIEMDVASAELTKYAANAMLAARISFMNEIACIAEKTGADIEHVRTGIGSDPRIGYSFIYPGMGYGGSCFPKDIQALAKTARDNHCNPLLLDAIEAVNERQKTVLFEKIKRHFKGKLKGRTIAVWGLTFKPNTNDMRRAPSRNLMEALWDAGATVRAYDPQGMEPTREIYGQRDDLNLCQSAESALEGADVLAICTEWKEFRSPDFAQLRKTLNEPVVFDGRNLFDPEVMHQNGLTYYAIGRGDRLED